MREPLVDGYLAPQLRQALPRLERVQTALFVREQLTAQAERSSRNLSPEESSRARAAELRQTRSRELLPGQPLPAARQRAVLNDQGVLEMLIDLRAMRAEVYQLARALGLPWRQSERISYRGILQQYDLTDPKLKRRRYIEQQDSREAEIAAQMRRSAAQQLTPRQLAQLEALKRAEQRLENAPPGSLPPGLHDALRGEIKRARLNIALSGDAQPLTLLSGMQFSAAA